MNPVHIGNRPFHIEFKAKSTHEKEFEHYWLLPFPEKEEIVVLGGNHDNSYLEYSLNVVYSEPGLYSCWSEWAKDLFKKREKFPYMFDRAFDDDMDQINKMETPLQLFCYLIRDLDMDPVFPIRASNPMYLFLADVRKIL